MSADKAGSVKWPVYLDVPCADCGRVPSGWLCYTEGGLFCQMHGDWIPEQQELDFISGADIAKLLAKFCQGTLWVKAGIEAARAGNKTAALDAVTYALALLQEGYNEVADLLGPEVAES